MSTGAGSRAGAAVFLVVGMIALGIGLWQGWSTVRFTQRAVAVTGTVIEATAHPGITFRTTAGVLVHYRQNGMGARPIGAAVPILYDPADPAATATVRDFWQLWFPAVGPALLGLAFIGLVVAGVEVEFRPGRY